MESDGSVWEMSKKQGMFGNVRRCRESMIIYSATKIRVHSFTCIFQLFKLIADISAWYIRKEHSIPRSGRGRSCGYDYWERYASWLNDIPPQTESHKIVRSQRVLALL